MRAAVIAGVLCCSLALPVCASVPVLRSRASLAPDQTDFKISWQAKCNVPQTRLRLYRIDQEGSELLLEESIARRGTGNFLYIEHEEIGGDLIQFRLCAVNENGKESVLGIIDCLRLSYRNTQKGSTLSFSAVPGMLPGSLVLSPFSVTSLQDPLNSGVGGTIPRPPTPPPRGIHQLNEI